MAFRRSDLQEAFFVPGTHAFRVWGYGTADPLEEVLAPNYFALARSMLRPGELIYVSAGTAGAAPGAARLALLMMRGDARGASSVRLVQDFGCPDDPAPGAEAMPSPPPAAPAQAAPAKRGRPPGSRTRQAEPSQA
jgi:hypothetical protein